MRRPVSALLILLIRVYQRFFSPLLGPRCRFVPSCSAYAVEALQVHGAGRGLLLTGWRLLRCQPFCRGGYDPVPAARSRPRQDEEGHDETGSARAAVRVSQRSLGRTARKGQDVRHNGLAAVHTAESGVGAGGAPGPPGRGDGQC